MEYTTPINGSETFPATANEFYKAVETIARQEINALKSASRLDDALFYYDLTNDNGTVIEQAVIKKAIAQAYDPINCTKKAVDPSLAMRYFQNWKTRQYFATYRKDEIRKILINRDMTVEDVTSEILATATQGNASDEFKFERELITTTEVTDFSSVLGGNPSNMKGVVFAIREMYNYLKGDNTLFTTNTWESHTPEEDIRIAIPERVMNLIDIGELSNVLNLSKEELFGKLVIIPETDLNAPSNKIIAYDRKAFNRARRIYDIELDPCVSARYVNYILTVEDMYFYSPLYKATTLDVSAAATAQFNALITPNAARSK